MCAWQGKVETRNPGRLEVYKGEWFSCSWKVTNIGGVAFAKGTKLSRVRQICRQDLFDRSVPVVGWGWRAGRLYAARGEHPSELNRENQCGEKQFRACVCFLEGATSCHWQSCRRCTKWNHTKALELGAVAVPCDELRQNTRRECRHSAGGIRWG